MLQPDQIPICWEVIKYCVARTLNISEEHREVTFNRLLYLLLSGKAQCFVRLSGEREILAVLVTKIGVDELTDDRTLYLEVTYSFKPVSDQDWIDLAEFMKKFARIAKCKYLSTTAYLPRAKEIAKLSGMNEVFTLYNMEV
jgi:hypothetical protein